MVKKQTIQTVICSICGKEVTKRSTYYVGTSPKNVAMRACKTHKNADIQMKVSKKHEKAKAKVAYAQKGNEAQ